MSDTSDQEIPPLTAFFTDDDEFCLQLNVDATPKMYFINPRKIFSSTFKVMNTICEQYGRPSHQIMPYHYYVWGQYFTTPTSDNYIVKFNESEWKFWFNHVITQLRKLQMSPQWKQNGKLDWNDGIMLKICSLALKRANVLKLSERSSVQVPKEVFDALASCIETLTPRLPHNGFVENITHFCVVLFQHDFDATILKMMEKSGFLIQVIRCSTIPLNDTSNINFFYCHLNRQVDFIKKKFKVDQPCGDIVCKILAGKEGYANPDPKVLNYLQTLSQLADTTKFSLTSTPNQKITIDDESYSAFYINENDFCFQRYGKLICVNPTKIFSSTFNTMNETFTHNLDIELGKYHTIFRYFLDDASKKYIAMLDESEWKFWFIHAIIKLRKLQTSPKWKQDGDVDWYDEMMLKISCFSVLNLTHELKISERSFQVPKEFFYALASCIDTLTPRLPKPDIAGIIVHTCQLFVDFDDDDDGGGDAMWNMIEASGLLVQVLRCSTIPLDNTRFTYRFYYLLTRRLDFIRKKFKVGKPCGDIIHKILAGKDGHSDPDPKVMNYLRTTSKLAEMTDFPLLDCNKIGQQDIMCTFCETSNSKHLRFCSGCRQVSYCSKECQRNHWKSHKQICRHLQGSNERNINMMYENLVERFMIDQRDNIFVALTNVMNIREKNKITDLMLDLDFVPDKTGTPPALSNPPRYYIIDGTSIPNVYPKHIKEQLESMIKNVKENQILCVYHSKSGWNMVIKDWGSRVVEG